MISVRQLKVEKERLAEMSYTEAVYNLPPYTKILQSKGRDSQIQLILREWPLTSKNYGFKTLRELINWEPGAPVAKKIYSSLSEIEKEDFWHRVDYIQTLLPK